MKKAVMWRGDKAWTITYEVTKENTIYVHDFNNEDQEGYIGGPLVGDLMSINEDEERIVQSIWIDGVLYDVDNKENVFTYKKPLV